MTDNRTFLVENAGVGRSCSIPLSLDQLPSSILREEEIDEQGCIRVYQAVHFEQRVSTLFSKLSPMRIEVTSMLNYFDLYERYCTHYRKKPEAGRHFCAYLKLDQFFLENLTEMQIMCVLGQYYYGRMKRIAEALELHEKTVRNHLCEVKSKLRFGNLEELVSFLRLEKERKNLKFFDKPGHFIPSF